jgi:putative endonuclease
MYYVYMLECADGTLYTGITTDLARRVEEHNSSDKGAKYTRARRPVKLVYSETHQDRSQASQREYHIKKKMTREAKKQLIKNMV